MTDVLDILSRIEQLLIKHQVIYGPMHKLRELYEHDRTAIWREINSDTWWGGAGSYADLIFPLRKGISAIEAWHDTREFDKALVELAAVMREAGIVSPQAESWAEIFRKREEDGTYEAIEKRMKEQERD